MTKKKNWRSGGFMRLSQGAIERGASGLYVYPQKDVKSIREKLREDEKLPPEAWRDSPHDWDLWHFDVGQELEEIVGVTVQPRDLLTSGSLEPL